jgi:hypothetical protein
MNSFIIGIIGIIMGVLELLYVKKAFIILGIITMIIGILIVVAYFYKN